MKKEIPTAFPWTHDDVTCTGMTLRDYFAAKAMQAVFSIHWDMFMNETYETPEDAVNETASDAYELADAMLKARGV